MVPFDGSSGYGRILIGMACHLIPDTSLIREKNYWLLLTGARKGCSRFVSPKTAFYGIKYLLYPNQYAYLSSLSKKNHILKDSGLRASDLYSPKFSYVAWGSKIQPSVLFCAQGKTLQDDARSSGERYLLPHLWCFGYRSGGIFFFYGFGWKELEVGSSCVVILC